MAWLGLGEDSGGMTQSSGKGNYLSLRHTQRGDILTKLTKLQKVYNDLFSGSKMNLSFKLVDTRKVALFFPKPLFNQSVVIISLIENV